LKKNTYPFARFFIRIAISLAILEVIFGLACVAFFYYSMTTQIAAARYEPVAVLGLDASQLERSYVGTEKRLLHSLNLTAFPDTVPLVNISDEIDAISKLGGVDQVKAYINLAKKTESSVDSIKKYHFAEFSVAVDQLRRALLIKAAALKQQYAPQQRLSATAAKSFSNSSNEAEIFRLFADASSNDEIRLNNINDLKQFLEEIRAKSQKKESLDQINQASIFLDGAKSLLDYMNKTEGSASSASQTASPQQEQEELVSQAEQVAALLQQYKSRLEQSLYESWVVDNDVVKLTNDAIGELNRATTADAQASAIRIEFARNMAISIIISLVLAFLIMVIADFLRAFLNMSNNTDTLTGAQ